MQNQLDRIIRNKAIYQKVDSLPMAVPIAVPMAVRGYSRTWQQCRSQVKIKNLVLTCVSC